MMRQPPSAPPTPPPAPPATEGQTPGGAPAPGAAPPGAASPTPTGVRLGSGTEISLNSEGGLVITGPDGTTQQIAWDAANVIPPQVPVIIGLGFAGIIGMILAFPIGRAIARYLDRKQVAPTRSDDVGQRLAAIEQAVDAVAVEMERLSEAHRFTTRLLTERVSAPDFTARAEPARGEPARGEPVRAETVRAGDAPRG